MIWEWAKENESDSDCTLHVNSNLSRFAAGRQGAIEVRREGERIGFKTLTYVCLGIGKVFWGISERNTSCM